MPDATKKDPPAQADRTISSRGRQILRNEAICLCTAGAECGKVLTIPAEGEALIGRAAECTFRFEEPTVSLRHARVVRSKATTTFHDLGSHNGSVINEVRVGEAPVVLRDGDTLQLGPSLMLRYALVSAEERAALEQVYQNSLRDGLTGIFNRKYFDMRLVAEIAFARRHETELSLLLVDLDHFKSINDLHGHLAGDEVLRRTAALFAGELRHQDVLARYGGEEFVIVLRGIDGTGALSIAERLRAHLESMPVVSGDARIAVTASIGATSLAECGAQDGAPALLALADARLYAAKRAGRNRVQGR
jgi:two-component system, cell cycle response regulator